jgi:GntP family gluconate:H+ symporter
MAVVATEIRLTGSGSVFLNHVGDSGFGLVKSCLGTSDADRFRTWPVLETVISVIGLVAVLALGYVL